MTHLIRVGKRNYERLHQLAGKLQARQGRKVSLDSAIDWLFSRKLGPLEGEIKAKTAQKQGKNGQNHGDPMRLFSLKQRKYIE